MMASEAMTQPKEKPVKYKTVKELAKYGTGAWGFAILTWIFIAVEVTCEVLIPFCSEFLIEIINPSAEAVATGYVISDHMGELWMYASIMLGLAVLSATCGGFGGVFAAKASAIFGRNVRQAMYYRIQEFSFSNIDKFSTPSLVTRLTTDVTNVQNSFQMIIRSVIRAPMMLICALILASIKSWQLSLVFLAVIPFLAAVLFGVAMKVHPVFVRVFEQYDNLNGSVQENLQGIRVVKSFGREKHENEKFSKVSYFIYKTFIKAERIIALNSPAMQFAIYTCMLLISFFGAKMIFDSGNAPDGFNTGSLSALFTYTMQILNSLMFVSMAFVMVIIARNSAERIVEVLKEESALKSPENPITEIPDGSIDFEDVNFSYYATAESNALNQITLHIPSGSTVGIIGSTGSSKTTLVSLIARLYDANQGVVKVGGHDVKEYDLVALRDAVSVVLQKNVLFSGTIRSNLLWGNPNATQEEIEHAAHLACADEFINKLPNGYDEPIDQGGTNVSGGQRQRLCIARALLKKPKILILDDSTSAVDTHTDAIIRASFQNEIPDVTKLIVAQRVLSIKECDIIVVMDKGSIIAQGSHDELLKQCTVYREIYESQSRGGDFDAAK